jgi:hypothetical protein
LKRVHSNHLDNNLMEPQITQAQTTLLGEFVKGKWEVFDNNIACSFPYKTATFASESIKTKAAKSAFEAFNLVLPDNVRLKCIEIINKNFANNLSEDSSKSEKSAKRKVEDIEFLKFIATKLLLELTMTPETRDIEIHFSKLDRNPLSKKRFKYIMNHFIPTLDEMADFVSLLNEVAKSLINPSSYVCIDENVLEYEIDSDVKKRKMAVLDQAPLMNYPSKPRSTGMVCFNAAVRFDDPNNPQLYKPYVFHWIPYIRQPYPKPHDIVRLVMESWVWQEKAYFITDSAFGNIDILRDVMKWGGGAVFAMPKPSDHHSLLSLTMNREGWKAAMQKETNIVSVYSTIPVKGREGDTASKYLLASHFNKIGIEPQIPLVQFAPLSYSAAASLAKMDRKDLRTLASRMGLPLSGSSVQLAERISGVKVTPKNPDEFIKMKGQKQYTRSSLESKGKRELEEMCHAMNIKTRKFLISLNFSEKKPKAQLIDDLFIHANDATLQKQNLDRLYSVISQNFHEGTCPVSEVYNTHFKYVDLHDYYFYRVEYEHRIQNWHIKLMVDMINSVIVNAYALHSYSFELTMVQFKRELFESIVEYCEQHND